MALRLQPWPCPAGRTGAPTTAKEPAEPTDAEESSAGKSESGSWVPVKVGPSPTSETSKPLTPERSTSSGLPLTRRTSRGEPMALLQGMAEGVEWKAGIFQSEGTLTPILEFSRVVPHDHPAVLQAYIGLSRCMLQLLADAWTTKGMCPTCHLPSSETGPCDCCDQKMCSICRARHARGQGIPGTGEPTGPFPVPAKTSPRLEEKGRDIPGYA